MILASVLLATGAVSAAKKLHVSLLHNVLKSPLGFFDTTPLGRVINRFSKDIDAIDLILPEISKFTILCLLGVVSTLVVISLGTQIFLIAMVPLMIVYIAVQVFVILTLVCVSVVVLFSYIHHFPACYYI